MKKNYTEIELRFPLFNPKQIIQKLNKTAHLKVEKLPQKDTYYVPIHRNFLDRKKVIEWLRIRETKDKIILNYKNWYSDIHCDEFETNIGDVVALKKIFEALNFKEIIVVEKIRSIWTYNDIEIFIDNIKDLGFFIELETKDDFSVEEANKLLYDVLKELKAETGPQDFRGYAYRMLEKKGYKFIN